MPASCDASQQSALTSRRGDAHAPPPPAIVTTADVVAAASVFDYGIATTCDLYCCASALAIATSTPSLTSSLSMHLLLDQRETISFWVIANAFASWNAFPMQTAYSALIRWLQTIVSDCVTLSQISTLTSCVIVAICAAAVLDTETCSTAAAAAVADVQD